MFTIKTMTQEDLQFAVRITDEADWGLTEDDFKFAMELEPEGCFVLLSNGEKIGLATNVCYDKIAWFGNLIVNKARRKQGAGSLLVKHSIHYLENRKTATIGLYAYAERIRFYTRLGFTRNSDFVVLQGKGFSSQPKPNLKPVQKADIGRVIDYDRACFGASRSKLLEPILSDSDNLCYACIDDGKIQGYAVAKVYRGMAELGPLTCPSGRSDIAINLLEAVLNKLKGMEISMFVPEKETAITGMLTEHDFSERFKVTRMFHGPPVADHCICMAESLERG